jgi:hypothetical protein
VIEASRRARALSAARGAFSLARRGQGRVCGWCGPTRRATSHRHRQPGSQVPSITSSSSRHVTDHAAASWSTAPSSFLLRMNCVQILLWLLGPLAELVASATCHVVRCWECYGSVIIVRLKYPAAKPIPSAKAQVAGCSRGSSRELSAQADVQAGRWSPRSPARPAGHGPRRWLNKVVGG